jgi:hypothetical protein
MAGSKRALTCTTMHQTSIPFFLRDLDGIWNQFYSLAAARMVHRGPAMLVQFRRTSIVVMSSSINAHAARTISAVVVGVVLPPPSDESAREALVGRFIKRGYQGRWQLGLDIKSHGEDSYL